MEPIRLAGGGLRLTVLPIGAVVQDLRFADGERSLVLGFADPEAYRAGKGAVGAVVGRFANRLRGGSFPLDGRRVEVDRNEGSNTLHGGTMGFHRRVWDVLDVGHASVTLGLVSADGDQGFPGTLRATCRYALQDPCTVMIDLEARTDAATVVSLAQHVYWNLDGAATIDGHDLAVRATRALATDAEGLPTTIEPAPSLGRLTGLVVDRNFCLADRRRLEPAPAASLTAGGVRLEVLTTEPGLQVYTGEHLNVAPFAPRAGLCLEAQAWPDAPNRPEFPSARLAPFEVYRQRTVWRLARV
ncbi:MAG: aldose epimerase family protein [Pseudomonadota bacterium]